MSSGGQRFTVPLGFNQLACADYLALGSPSCGSSSPFLAATLLPTATPIHPLFTTACWPWAEKQRKLSLARLVYRRKVFTLGNRPLEDIICSLPHSALYEPAFPSPGPGTQVTIYDLCSLHEFEGDARDGWS